MEIFNNLHNKQMKNKKTANWLLPLILLLGTTFFSGCSNNTNSVIDDDNLPADPRGSWVTFNLGVADYDAYHHTRSTDVNSEGRVLASSTQNLGDGLEALVEVVKTPIAQTKTRAVKVVPAGKYTIVAYQNGEEKAKWVLNYTNATNYTAIEGTNKQQLLPEGDYDFYVFNDRLVLENGKILAKLSNAKEGSLFAKVEKKHIGSVRKTKISFTLKPYFAEVKLKIKGFSTPAFVGTTTGCFAYDASAIPATIALNPVDGTSTSTNNTAASTTTNFTFGTNVEDNGNSYIESTSAQYFLPGTDVTKLRFKFADNNTQIYQKAIAAGKTLAISKPLDENLKASTSYTIAVTVYYTATYLFSDGTTGTMGNKGNRTPIALVVGKENGYNFAIALQDAVQKAPWALSTAYGNDKNWGRINDAINLYDGYEITYNPPKTKKPNNDKYSLIKADNPNYNAFYAAAHYQPGVTLSGTLANPQWFLPGIGEWSLAFKTFGAKDLLNSVYNNWQDYEDPLKYQRVQILFQQAEGEPVNTYYWSADTKGGTAYTVVIRNPKTDTDKSGKNKTKSSEAQKADKNAGVRSFIRF